MVKSFFVLVIIFFFYSCEKQIQMPQEMILGNWSVVNSDNVKPWEKDIRGFEFLPNNICDYKLGYLDWNRYMADSITDREKRVVYSLGTQTKYAVSKDSLKIFDLTKKKWDRYKIKNFNKDTLVIKKDTIVTTLIKKNYIISNVPDFDAVIVSSSSCFGPCPMNDIIILKNGNVLYKGSYHVPKKGWYTSKISISDFDKIQKRFKEADYLKLKNTYSTMVTDSQSISISFVKDGKIIKTIEDYAQSSPNEFVWAYLPLVVLSQELVLKPTSINSHLDIEFFYSSFVTTDRMKGFNLAETEAFYLLALLMHAKNVDVKFDEKYFLNYNNAYINQVTTDGRYYKLYFKNGKTEVKDIDFNFITDNKLNGKLEIIKK